MLSICLKKRNSYLIFEKKYQKEHPNAVNDLVDKGEKLPLNKKLKSVLGTFYHMQKESLRQKRRTIIKECIHAYLDAFNKWNSLQSQGKMQNLTSTLATLHVSFDTLDKNNLSIRKKKTYTESSKRSSLLRKSFRGH